MKPLNFISITFSLLLLAACHRQNKASKEMAAYLSGNYQLEINDSTIYCFFPSNQCKNCFLYNAAYIVPEINEHTVVITGYDSTNFRGFRHVLHDADDTMLELQALDYGNRIITFKNGTIIRNEVVKDLYAQLGNAWLGL